MMMITNNEQTVLGFLLEILIYILCIGHVHYFLQHFFFIPFSQYCLHSGTANTQTTATPTNTNEKDSKWRPPTPPFTEKSLKMKKRVVNDGDGLVTPPNELEDQNHLIEMKKWKFQTACYKFCSFSTLATIGFLSLLLDNYHYATQYSQQYIPITDLKWINKSWIYNGLMFLYDTYPRNTEVGFELDILYKLQLSYYLYSVVLVYFDLEGPKQKDKGQMLVHHFSTIGLLLFSWVYKFQRIGGMITCLHDLSDPFMEIAKLSLYSNHQLQANLFFALFALIFLISRCLVFPLYIVIPSFRYLFSENGWMRAMIYLGNYVWLPLGLLVVLQVLHFIWGGMIIKMVIEALTKGDVGEDIRDEE